ncbi:FHA domain-containing protein [Paucibacter sp. JuS9]|uniref:FHA domain-containing protein n=1 Tax=Paucibacter sp. JuS9 TaxID=3228748 RepID=UPI0037565D6C
MSMLSRQFKGVSERHALLYVETGIVKLMDLGSTNGTFVHSNGRSRRVTADVAEDLSLPARVQLGEHCFLDLNSAPTSGATP